MLIVSLLIDTIVSGYYDDFVITHEHPRLRPCDLDMQACDFWLMDLRGGVPGDFDDDEVTAPMPMLTMGEIVTIGACDGYRKPHRHDHATEIATTQPLRAVQS